MHALATCRQNWVVFERRPLVTVAPAKWRGVAARSQLLIHLRAKPIVLRHTISETESLSSMPFSSRRIRSRITLGAARKTCPMDRRLTNVAADKHFSDAASPQLLGVLAAEPRR
jgi:hypothetical protein